jgi:hypothetical protein
LFSFTSVGRLPMNSIQVGSGHARGKEVHGSHGRAQAGSGSVERAGAARRGVAQRMTAAPALSVYWSRGAEGARVG